MLPASCQYKSCLLCGEKGEHAFKGMLCPEGSHTAARSLLDLLNIAACTAQSWKAGQYAIWSSLCLSSRGREGTTQRQHTQQYNMTLWRCFSWRYHRLHALREAEMRAQTAAPLLASKSLHPIHGHNWSATEQHSRVQGVVVGMQPFPRQSWQVDGTLLSTAAEPLPHSPHLHMLDAIFKRSNKTHDITVLLWELVKSIQATHSPTTALSSLLFFGRHWHIATKQAPTLRRRHRAPLALPYTQSAQAAGDKGSRATTLCHHTIPSCCQRSLQTEHWARIHLPGQQFARPKALTCLM